MTYNVSSGTLNSFIFDVTKYRDREGVTQDH